LVSSFDLLIIVFVVNNLQFLHRSYLLGLCFNEINLFKLTANSQWFYWSRLWAGLSEKRLGAVQCHKRRPQSKGGVSSSDKGGGAFRCGRSHFLLQIIKDFFKFMVCPHGQKGEGLSQCEQGGLFINIRIFLSDLAIAFYLVMRI